jgi:uncharacterized protein (DUF2267 family)
MIERSFVWLKDVDRQMGWRNRGRSYRALSAVLHALRDRLTVAEATELGAQLPVIIRGIYYEGWKPGDKPMKLRSCEQFFSHIRSELVGESPLDTEEIARGVFAVLSRRVSGGEIEDIVQSLPERLRALWEA